MYRPEDLNDIQKSAVLETDGAVLVTAGAGSGKTRLLTHRITHLIKDLGVAPYNVLAITFTNKAANEMRIRLGGMIETEGIWIFTFHAACVRILRRFIDRIGFDKNFTIYGDSETKSIVKRICKTKGYPEDMVKRILCEISSAKSDGVLPEFYENEHKFSRDAEKIAEAYKIYQNTLKQNNALDYDDLLIQTYNLLRSNAEAREFYQNKFKYIHIDEFQDTNTIQYEIVKILAAKHGNIFAVGDEDQCIYTWRGASVANMKNFRKDFDCKLIKLEQNYRSTSNILEVANKIIKGNSNRFDKNLWTANGDGEKAVCFGAASEGFEADYVVRAIYDLTHGGDYNYSDCAVLLRLNALTRPFEERFMQYGIPHRVYGGFKFYDRKEVKDVLAYARLSVNHADDEALLRIINFPRRGIGEASIEKLRDYAARSGKSLYDIVVSASAMPFATSLKEKLIGFGNVLENLSKAAEGEVTAFFKYLLFDVLNVVNLFSNDSDDESRLENLNELINSVREFSVNNPSADVSDYLQTVSLYSDTDDINEDNCVTVATVHSAKGLEFPVVFVIGLEDGIFPSLRENESDNSHMEEERRLMYVAVTRAMERLYLTYAKSRFLYGKTDYRMASRFLRECGLVESEIKRRDYDDGYSFGSRSYGNVGDFSRASTISVPRKTFGDTAGGSTFSGAYKSDYGKSDSNRKVADDKDKSKFAVGVTVMHKRLGKGKVVGLESTGGVLYAKIDFERGGVMLLTVDCAPLTVLD